MKSEQRRANAMLFLAALIWGTAFVAQKDGMDYVGPFTYTAELIMSLETVFATMAGALILHEMLTERELAGCFIMFAAIIISQMRTE